MLDCEYFNFWTALHAQAALVWSEPLKDQGLYFCKSCNPVSCVSMSLFIQGIKLRILYQNSPTLIDMGKWQLKQASWSLPSSCWYMCVCVVYFFYPSFYVSISSSAIMFCQTVTYVLFHLLYCRQELQQYLYLYHLLHFWALRVYLHLLMKSR